MKFHPRWAATALFVVALGSSSVANAALVDRGGGLIYDTDTFNAFSGFAFHEYLRLF